MRPLKIYLASSWRNKHYETVLQVLRFQGYETYDFKHPEDQSLSGFSWENLHKDVKSWTCEDFKQNLHHPEATNAFEKDFRAMHEADYCVLLLPCGRSAHSEAEGNDKNSFISIDDSSKIIEVKDATIVVKNKKDTTTSKLGYHSAAINTGDSSLAIAADKSSNCIASCTGSKSVSECKGNFSIAANVGDYSVATSSGQYSAAINIARYSIVESTGDYSVAVATSERSSAKVEGKDSIAIVCGTNGKASGRLGCWLILTERGEWNGKEYTLKDVKSIKVDGKKIKEDTWYKLKNGEIIEEGLSKDPIDP